MYHKGVAWRGGLATPDGLPSVASGGGRVLLMRSFRFRNAHQRRVLNAAALDARRKTGGGAGRFADYHTPSALAAYVNPRRNFRIVAVWTVQHKDVRHFLWLPSRPRPYGRDAFLQFSRVECRLDYRAIMTEKLCDFNLYRSGFACELERIFQFQRCAGTDLLEV